MSSTGLAADESNVTLWMNSTTVSANVTNLRMLMPVRRVCWPSSGHSLAAVMIPAVPALGDLHSQHPITDDTLMPLNIPEHTHIVWSLLSSPGASALFQGHTFPTFALKLETVSNSLIPWASMVPHDPTPQCPPTHIYKNRTIFSWIPLCAWHLLLLLPHILRTKGCAYTCSLAHTWINSLVHTQSHVSGARGGFMLSLGGTQWLLRCCVSSALATSL